MASGRRSSGIIDVIGFIAGLALVGGPILAWLRLVPPLIGFYLFLLGGLVSVVAAITALVNSVRDRGFGLGRTVALLAAMIFVFTAFGRGSAPIINDYTTNLDDPPAFRHASTLPANAGRDLAYPVDFKESQRSCCADLHAAKLSVPPAEALQRAERVATQTPRWTIVNVDRDGGTLEATDESVVFGFVDDIVVRVRPEGTGSIVDVRSKSRDGRGDQGANAARIRAYVKALETTG